MSTEIQSFVKVGDAFVRIEDYEGQLPDPYYIEGAICCKIGGQEILGFKQWDLIDQLWAYVVEGLATVNRGEVYESTFPDQPLKLRLEPSADQSITVSIGNARYRFRRCEFVLAMSEGAERFFITMNNLLPSGSATWNRYLAEITSLKDQADK